jgi:hypothetical protein
LEDIVVVNLSGGMVLIVLRKLFLRLHLVLDKKAVDLR